MSDHLPVLKVRLFGGFSASYGEIPVSFGRNTTTKAMKLLQILLYHGDTGISRDKLLDELYGREELADAANNLRVTAHRLKKIIVDAGLGRPSQACEAMEMGAAAVMANTAIATAGDVPAMAEAFKKAIEAGRSAYLSGLGRTIERGASASSPLTGFLQD